MARDVGRHPRREEIRVRVEARVDREARAVGVAAGDDAGENLDAGRVLIRSGTGSLVLTDKGLAAPSTLDDATREAMANLKSDLDPYRANGAVPYDCAEALMTLVGAIILAAGACGTPEPAEPAACTGAIFILMGAMRHYQEACNVALEMSEE